MLAGWHGIAPPMRAKYQRFVELGNAGARELGFADLGELWRAKYDMPPEAFAAELDRLWLQVKPLYDALHCYVRSRLTAVYGADVVPPGKPIPAHLVGNLWAQQWGGIYDLVKPANAVDPGYSVTERLQAKGYDARQMVETGERFFTSLGLAPLPATFWTRSLFTKPRDRDVRSVTPAPGPSRSRTICASRCASSDRLEEFYEILAYHYSRSDNCEIAYQYLKLSGDRALRSYANWEAFRFYKEAISLLDKLPDTEENRREKIRVRLAIDSPIRLLSYPEDSLSILEEGDRLGQRAR